MKYFIVIFLVLLFSSCKKDYIADKGINLDVVNAISINESENFGVVSLPSDAGTEINKYFDKYTRVVADNGKYIHIFGPSEVSNYELARMREVLIGILTDYESGAHGVDKSAVRNYLADQNSCLMILMNAETLLKVSEGVLLASPIDIHPVLYEEIIPEGSSNFINSSLVDKSMRKLMRMVLKTGIANTNFGYNSEIYNASNNARNTSIWTPSNVDTLLSLGEIGLAYANTLLEVYYGQWQQIGTVNNGEYLYADRATLSSDPLGLASVESFFPPYLPYKIIIDPTYSSDLDLNFNAGINYTYKSQYFSIVDISASACANIIGNAYSNVFTGNSLNNIFEGKEGDDYMDGKDGFDIAVYSGIRTDYLIFTSTDGITIVQDTIPNRDGLDTLINFERLQFQDINLDL